jgi:uncharacterized protein YceK
VLDSANMKATLNVCLAAAILFLTGCSSITARWRGERGRAYPGVRMDIDQVRTYGTEGDLIAILDMPFSALVDTFFIPWDVDGEETALQAQR